MDNTGLELGSCQGTENGRHEWITVDLLMKTRYR